MDIFGRKTKQLRKDINRVKDNLKESFSKVKEDMDYTASWLNYYYEKSRYFESKLNQVLDQSDQLDSAIRGASSSIDTHSKMISELTKNMANALQQISSLHATLHASAGDDLSKDQFNFHIEKISNELIKIEEKFENFTYLPAKLDSLKEQLSEHITEPHFAPTEVEKRMNEIQEKLRNIVVKKSPKDKLIQKVTKNSHDYLKAMVLSYIKKYEKISALQLREMVVEEQNLTSKSTFYRIIEEIESLEEVSIIRQGKEKIYLAKLKKLH